MAKERQCIACGKTYEYCPSCSRADSLKEAWHTDFCSIDCKTLWHTATGYNIGIITKDEAQKVISGLKLKERKQYSACLQKDLDKILGKKPTIAVQKTAKAPAVKVEKTENIPAPKAEETPAVEKADELHEVVIKENE